MDFGWLRQSSEASFQLLQGIFNWMDWLFAHPRVIGWGTVALVVWGAVLQAKDVWLLILGIGLFLWGLSMRRRAIRRSHGYL